ncbi:MAG: hypothetical protein M1829_000777 [Trizodia sp. TS-e1964]|nr:MAG: hypothetical protein M1829_000777 [Trizodia sp. TS-e1964]
MTKKISRKQVDIENEARFNLLSIIDRFREIGVSEDISLPQIVVVGDQSSGKSSLLEGLTSLPFPVASELCTRFATQIVFRRSSAQEESIHVSIIPAVNSDQDRKNDLARFDHHHDGELSEESFAKLLDEAALYMGLPTIGGDFENIEKRFSDDVLKIELSGPEHPHISFVDCPGLFHNPTKYQTLEDAAIIKGLIESYVKNPRTIIMAVMNSLNNLANQEVFRIAKAADPQGLRTVGIMTKCDAVQKGDEMGVIKIAKNETERLLHGWFCVRNRSTEEINSGVTIEMRHIKESEFFKTKPWSSLDKKHVGIHSLKVFLGNLLHQHVANEFPSLRKEMESLKARQKKRLEALGASRQTPQDQRQYLTRIATAHRAKAVDALAGRYTEAGRHPLKLRMHTQDAKDIFAKKMSKEGCLMKFRNTDEQLPTELDDEQLENRLNSYESLEVSGTDTNIYQWIRDLYKASRGTELPGHVNPTVIEQLFRQLTIKWEPIAESYIANVVKRIAAFNDALFEKSCYDKTILKRICSRIEPLIKRSIEEGNSSLQKILEDERAGILQTANHYFAENLEASRKERAISRLKHSGYATGQDHTISFDMLVSLGHRSNEESAVYDIHDTLKAYYKVALKRFTDNVVVQVVERSFLSERGPVHIFNPTYVAELPDADLAAIAAEDYATSSERTEIRFQIERLEKALELAATVSV